MNGLLVGGEAESVRMQMFQYQLHVLWSQASHSAPLLTYHETRLLILHCLSHRCSEIYIAECQ